MKPRTLLWAFALALLLAGFLVGAAEVFRLRLDLSGAFPEYSTYRADPMGTQALYRALSGLPQLRVERNERDITLLHGDEHTALFLLGVDESPDPYKLAQKLEEYVVDGARLVITYGIRGQQNFYTLDEPEAESYRQEHSSTEERIKDWIKREKIPAVTPDRPLPDWVGGEGVLISERWGYRVVQPQSAEDFEDGPELQVEPLPDKGFSEKVRWESPEYLLPMHEGWEVLYQAKDGRPVLMRRAFGKGDVVVASDTFFASNEGLRADLHPELLAWIIGDRTHVIFDESSKGVDRSPGIMALMKRYHLHVALLMAVLLAALYIWRGSVPLLPRRNAEQERERAILLLGRDAHAGLAALLRRAAPPDAVLRLCFDEWQNTLGKHSTVSRENFAEARRLLESDGDGDRVERYRAAAALLRERRSP